MNARAGGARSFAFAHFKKNLSRVAGDVTDERWGPRVPRVWRLGPTFPFHYDDRWRDAVAVRPLFHLSEPAVAFGKLAPRLI